MIIRQQLARRAAEELPRHLVGCDEVRVLQPGDRGEEVGTLVFKDGALVVKRFFSQAPIFPIERTPFLPCVGKMNVFSVFLLMPLFLSQVGSRMALASWEARAVT